MPVNKTIAVSMIDDPENAMRTEMDDDRMRELIASIEKDGLTNPIAVTQAGQRYMLIAGHRRLVAHRRMAREMIEVRDYTGEKVEVESIKFSENFSREDVSDADVAVWLADLVEKHNYDSERLMAITGKSENWISSRLALFNGDEMVFNALRAGQINLGTAAALNRFPDDYRRQYLDVCISTTPPIKLVLDWLDKLKMMQQSAAIAQPDGDTGEAAPLAQGVVIECCEICGGDTLLHMMRYYKIHSHCFDMVQQAMRQAEKG